MLHTPVDPYRRSYTTSRCSSTSKSIPLTSSSSSLPTYFSSSSPFDRYPPPPVRSQSLNSTLSASYTRSSSAASSRSRSSTIASNGNGDILIKRDVLDRLKGSLSPAISHRGRRSSISSFRSTSTRAPSFTSSPLQYSSQDLPHAFLCSLDVSNRLSRFLAYYLTSYLPRTLFIHHFSRSAITTTCATPFKVVSTPDSSPSATPPSSKQFFWIRAPALLPTTIDPRESIPALPALFDSFESPVIELAGDVWHFEKIGPELDQSFWHLHLAGEETFAIKVVFDQAYGGLGS